MIAGGAMDSSVFWALVLMLSTLLNIAYLLPIPIRVFFKADPAVAPGEASPREEASAPMRWALSLTAAISVLLFFYPAPLVDLLALIQWR